MMHNLIYRNQFVFSNSEISGFESFIKFYLIHKTQKWFLCHHPDLPVIRLCKDDCELILLGYILDPKKPTHDDLGIMKELHSFHSIESLAKGIKGYTGRFAIIRKDKSDIHIINDAVGFREVYYMQRNSLIACGSTPNILAQIFNIPLTKDPSRHKFLSSREFQQADHTWIGFQTLYDPINQLPANHYLNLSSLQTFRFWPETPLNKMPLSHVADACATILKGTIDSAQKRFKLHMGVTAGFDTRLLLSATHDYKENIFYYLNRPPEFNEKHRDLRIAKKLSSSLNFKLNIIEIPAWVDSDFRKNFYMNNILAHEKLLPVFYEVHQRNWQNTHTVSGVMGNGLARIYMQFPKGVAITGKNVAAFSGYQELEYPVTALNSWLNEVIPICRNLNISIMDLFQWEQENAHWATRTSSEQDIVREEIIPFNNRELIEYFWSLDPKYRYQYHPEIYFQIMRILWPEVLRYPFNPGFRTCLYTIPRMFGIEQRIYRLYKRQKFLKSLK